MQVLYLANRLNSIMLYTRKTKYVMSSWYLGRASPLNQTYLTPTPNQLLRMVSPYGNYPDIVKGYLCPPFWGILNTPPKRVLHVICNKAPRTSNKPFFNHLKSLILPCVYTKVS